MIIQQRPLSLPGSPFLIMRSFLFAASLLFVTPSMAFAADWASPEGWNDRDVRVCYAQTMQVAIEENLVIRASTVKEHCACVVKFHKQDLTSESCKMFTYANEDACLFGD